MSKEIWVPKSETHVIVEADGEIKIWDNMIMIKEKIEKDKFGFDNKEKDK